LDYWAPSDIHPRERNSKRSTYYQWCALPTRRAMVTDTHSPYTLQGEVPKCMLLDLQDQEEVPCDVIRSVARFRLCAHTLRIETVTWTHNTSPTYDLCNAHDVQPEDEQHVLFHCTHPHVVSLQWAYASLFSSAGLKNASAFLGQETISYISTFMH